MAKPKKTRRRTTSGKVARAVAKRAAERRADPDLVERTLDLIADEDLRAAGARRRIGAHVLDAYFAGDEDLARSRSPAKRKSYALLVERAGEETSWDARDLYEAVTAEITARSLPAQIADALEPTWLLRLSSVDDLEARRSLAARLARGDLDGHAAREAVAKASGVVRRGGRPRAPGIARAVAALERTLGRAAGDGALADEALGAIADPPQRDGLARRVRALIAALTELAERLAAGRG